MDRFVASQTIETEGKGRALAVKRYDDRTIAFVAGELHGEIAAFELADGQWASLFAQPVEGGPRAVCVVGNDVLVASTSGSALSLFAFDGQALTLVTSVELALPPTALSCADIDGDDRLDALVAVGSEADASLMLFEGPELAAGVDFPFPSASYVRLADLDADGDLDAIALATASDALLVLRNDDGAFFAGPQHALPCAAPRAADVLTGPPDGTLAIACDGAVLLMSDASLPEPTLSSSEGQPRLYDLTSGDFDRDGRPDWASVGIVEHALSISFGTQGEPVAFDHPVALGPVALQSIDVEDDGDLDLIVLSFEDARLSLFVNEL